MIEVVSPRSPFWRMDDPILDANGQVVTGGMWWHQRQWWELPNFIRGLVTGYGGGKTMSLAKRMIALALHNAPVPVITVSPTYPMAETTIVESISELLEGRAQGSGWVWDENGPRFDPTQVLEWTLKKSQPYRFEIKYKGRRGRILCMSGEHPKRLKGSNIAAAGIDEPFMQSRAVFDQVVARVRHPQAKRKEINITGTPEGVVGWGYELFEGELREKHDVGLVQCSSRENRALDPEYTNRMDSSFDDTARAAYVEGKFVNMASGCVFHAFDATVNIADMDAPESAEWGCGMDFNVNPMAFAVFWRVGDHIHFVDEFELPNSDTQDACIRLREAYPQVDDIYPDASGKNRSTKAPRGESDFSYIRDAGYAIRAPRANPALRDRFNSANGALRHRRVTISRKCKKLRTYLMAYSHEEMHREEQKAMSHLLDAWSYPIHFLMPATKAAVVAVEDY